MPGFTYADGITLKNRFNITDPVKLDRIEEAFTRYRIQAILRSAGIAGDTPNLDLRARCSGLKSYDLTHLKAIHRDIFEDVYEWAGHSRQERFKFQDGSIASEAVLQRPGSQAFAIGPAIETAIATITAPLAPLAKPGSLSQKEFIDLASETLAGLNSVHPFREGNGRTQRIFLQQFAQAAGHPINFEIISGERMIRASIAAHEEHDLAPMRHLIADASIAERQVLLANAIRSMQTHKFNWNSQYIASIHDEPAQRLIMAGYAHDQFMAHSKDKILLGYRSQLPQPEPERQSAFDYVPPQPQRSRANAEDKAAAAGKAPKRIDQRSATTAAVKTKQKRPRQGVSLGR